MRQDHDLIFCRDDGTPGPPDLVSRRFKALAKDAGVPVIKLPLDMLTAPEGIDRLIRDLGK